MLDPKVSKAYDVRGIYPEELDEAGAEAIGRTYVEQFEPRKIAVGRDMRLSSPTMQEAVIRGAVNAGCDVLDIGLVGTEMVYYAVGSLGLEGGIMVTASHNPKEYTGMKIVRRGALPVGGESGLLDVRDRRVGSGGLRHSALRRDLAGERAGRERDRRRPRKPRGSRHDRARGRHRARQPRRPRVHQGADAQRRRCLRRRGVRPLLLP